MSEQPSTDGSANDFAQAIRLLHVLRAFMWTSANKPNSARVDPLYPAPKEDREKIFRAAEPLLEKYPYGFSSQQSPEPGGEPICWTVEASHDGSLCSPFWYREVADKYAEGKRLQHPSVTWTVVPLYRSAPTKSALPDAHNQTEGEKHGR